MLSFLAFLFSRLLATLLYNFNSSLCFLSLFTYGVEPVPALHLQLTLKPLWFIPKNASPSPFSAVRCCSLLAVKHHLSDFRVVSMSPSSSTRVDSPFSRYPSLPRTATGIAPTPLLPPVAQHDYLVVVSRLQVSLPGQNIGLPPSPESTYHLPS